MKSQKEEDVRPIVGGLRLIPTQSEAAQFPPPMSFSGGVLETSLSTLTWNQ